MTRKELDAFIPSTLPRGRSRYFEVRNPKTGFGEHHCFYRNTDGILFFSVTKFNKFQEFRRTLHAGGDRVAVIQNMINLLKDAAQQTGNQQSGELVFGKKFPIDNLTITVSPEAAI